MTICYQSTGIINAARDRIVLGWCVGEGVAATQARRMAAQATDVQTRDALSIIARDEQTHANLAMDTLRFCLSAGGKSIRDALAESIEGKWSSEENGHGLRGRYEARERADQDELRRLGCADRATQRLAGEEALETSIRLVAKSSRRLS